MVGLFQSVDADPVHVRSVADAELNVAKTDMKTNHHPLIGKAIGFIHQSFSGHFFLIPSENLVV